MKNWEKFWKLRVCFKENWTKDCETQKLFNGSCLKLVVKIWQSPQLLQFGSKMLCCPQVKTLWKHSPPMNDVSCLRKSKRFDHKKYLLLANFFGKIESIVQSFTVMLRCCCTFSCSTSKRICWVRTFLELLKTAKPHCKTENVQRQTPNIINRYPFFPQNVKSWNEIFMKGCMDFRRETKILRKRMCSWIKIQRILWTR